VGLHTAAHRLAGLCIVQPTIRNTTTARLPGSSRLEVSEIKGHKMALAQPYSCHSDRHTITMRMQWRFLVHSISSQQWLGPDDSTSQRHLKGSCTVSQCNAATSKLSYNHNTEALAAYFGTITTNAVWQRTACNMLPAVLPCYAALRLPSAAAQPHLLR
jgi:hypothetical protein